MKRASVSILAACILAGAPTAYAELAPYQGISVPGVKLSTVKEPSSNEVRPAIAAIAPPVIDEPVSNGVPADAADTKQKRPEQYPLDLAVTPGVNELISVSRGYPNRILTPFNDPVVDMLSNTNATYDKKGNVILLAPQSDRPIGLYIREKGEFAEAISLTLIPKAIPPREIHLRLNSSSPYTRKGSERARTWEQSEPFITTLGKLYEKLIKGELPDGYSMSQPRAEDIYSFNCDFGDAPISTTLEQVVEGGNLRVGVLSAFNNSDYVLEPNEKACNNLDVASVAFWPPQIQPRGYSEIFIVTHRKTEFDKKPERPSVIPMQPGY